MFPGILAGLALSLTAPSIIRTPGLLMPVKPPKQNGGYSVAASGYSEMIVIDESGLRHRVRQGDAIFMHPGGRITIQRAVA
jgi:hypothetical protein